jgi:hypothetical protein
MELFRGMTLQKIKVGVAAFIGLHVPLVALAGYALMTDFKALLPVLLVVLFSTLIAVLGTIVALLYILKDQSNVEQTDTNYSYS